ncbi:hypothetical protein ACFW04_003590 [Cataglyphis niger]
MSLFLLVVSAISVIIFYKIVLIVYSHYTMRKKLSHIPGTMDYSLLETLYDMMKSLDVKQWYRDRRILSSVFHFNILEQFAVIMSEKTEIIIKCIEEKLTENSTKIIDILPFIQKLAFNIICDKQKRKAFIDLLLDMNEKDGVSLTDEDLRAQVSTFLFAGHDTTAVSISWALFCIGNDPQCQEKIHEELKEIFKDSQRPASIKELSQLKYLERVIKESRRLYPSIPIILRKISEDVKMGNYVIPKNTLVAVPIMLIHRNPAIWQDPLKFDPDRFLPENLKQIHSYAYIPFSAGSRNCIGQKFAVIEEKVILTAILRKWRVKSMKMHEEMTMHNSAVLRPSEESIYLQLLSKK